tara:strand:- start:48 stop:263 length:216 start_codon:yes stop_codon:yes gene_type:complete
MSKIIKTTQGETSFRLKEEFENEDKAIQGKEPLDSEVLIDDLKIENIKYKLKEELKDGDTGTKATETREKA